MSKTHKKRRRAKSKSGQKGNGKLNRAAVDKLLLTREGIMHAHPGQVFEDSSKLIHRAHEK